VLAGTFGLESVKPEIAKQAKTNPKATAMQATMSSLDGLLEDLVAHHQQPLPLEEPDPHQVRSLEPYVGVRLPEPKPEKLRVLGGRFVGARRHQLQPHKRAAMLRYTVRDRHRVTLYVFDPRRVPMRTRQVKLQRRYIKPRDVTVYSGRMSGYSVAASERNGVGYALATDLPDEESTNLILVMAD